MHEETYIEQTIEKDLADLLREEIRKDITRLSKWGLSEHDKTLLTNFEKYEKTN